MSPNACLLLTWLAAGAAEATPPSTTGGLVAPANAAAPSLAPLPALQRPATRPRRKRKLMIAGLSVFGGTYGATALLGVWGLELEKDCREDCRAGRLLIPVAGPWLSLGSDGDAAMVLLGLGQAVGLTLGIIGFHQLLTSGGAAPAPSDATALGFAVAPTVGGGVGLLRGRF